METFKNVTLDSLSISAFSAGIAVLTNGDVLIGGILVFTGVIISAVKYFTRSA